jgi:hypothetical protein
LALAKCNIAFPTIQSQNMTAACRAGKFDKPVSKRVQQRIHREWSVNMDDSRSDPNFTAFYSILQEFSQLSAYTLQSR